MQCTISSPIGCSSHRAPRLASCLSRAGPWSREFPALTTRKRGGRMTSPASSPGSIGPRPRGRCQQAPQLPYHVVAVLDLRRVRKAPRKQSTLFHATLIRDLLQLSPFLHSHAGSPDGVKRHRWRRRRPDLLPDLAPAASTVLPAWPPTSPSRARVSGVSSVPHEEVGEHLASPASSPGSTDQGLAAGARRRHIYRKKERNLLQ
jgi:hypothetical protein